MTREIDRLRPYRTGRRNPRNIYAVDTWSDDYRDDQHVACAFEPGFGPVIANALNEQAERKAGISARSPGGAAQSAVDDTDGEAESQGEPHRARAEEYLADARSYYLRAIARHLTEAERGDAVLRVRLLCGLAYGHALLFAGGDS
jgi:hypothetical protein